MISGQITAVLIMFAITVVFASILLVPVTCFARKSRTVNFYWSGFWILLAVIAATAGGNAVLGILGESEPFIATRVFPMMVGLYVCFVIVGWFHLSGKAALAIFNRARG